MAKKATFKSSLPREDLKSKSDADAKESTQKHIVQFGVHIHGMGTYTKEELENDADVRQYLLDIGSPAVLIVSPDKN